MEWEILEGDAVSQPFAEAEVAALLEAGKLGATVLVRPVGKQAWKPALRHGRFAAASRTFDRSSGRAGAPPSAARSQIEPPSKDPARWDQLTYVNMPVSLPVNVPAQPAEPTAGIGAAGPHRHVAPPASPTTRPGVFGGLFDLSFTTFVTTRIVRVLYVFFLLVVAMGLAAGILGGLANLQIASTRDSDRALFLGLAQLALTPPACLVLVVCGRIFFECIVVFFRVAEHLGDINRKTRE